MEKFSKLKEDMNNHALRDYPLEAVGIITKDYKYIPCKNISDLPKETFYLDPAALVKHDGNIWGIFHSHPGQKTQFLVKKTKLEQHSKSINFWLDSIINFTYTGIMKKLMH